MADLFDYLTWRGDLTLAQAPFNDVDNLIFCALSYVRLGGVVPGPDEGAPVPLAQAAADFFARRKEPLPKADTKDFDAHNLLLLDALAKCPRFASLLLSDYVDVLDPACEKQFAALTIHLDGKSAFLAFRGTDNTLVGWKEDFNMSFLPQVPSQRSAADYLSRAALRFRTLRVGGHSKGGNLAVYAAANCSSPVRKKLVAVYNNDGPGFSANLISRPEYLAVRDRVHTFVPQSSVVGMLMDHEECYSVVHSTQMGILQHDPYSWEVLGPAFSLMENVTDSSRFLSLTLKNWMAAMEPAQREAVIDALFQVFASTKASTLSELSADWLSTAGTVLQELKDMDPATRKMLLQMLGLLLDAARRNMPQVLPKRAVALSPKS